MGGAKTQSEMLDVVERNVDPDWLANIRDIGPGYEALRAQAAIMARASLAIGHADDCCFIVSAPAGGFSVVPVRFRRDSIVAGLYTIKAGSIVSTPFGRRFIVQQDVTMGGHSVLTTFVPARAEFPGYEWDVPGEQDAVDGTTIPGAVSVAELILTDPPMVDLTIQVESVDPGTGGAPPVLELHGTDRGLPRLPGEQAEIYRERIRSIPLAITGPNIMAALKAVLRPYGAPPPVMIECFEATRFGALDWTDPEPPFVPDAGLFPFQVDGTWQDVASQFGCFFVELAPMQAIEDFGLMLDDPMVGVGDLVSPQSMGRRCVSAYDLDNTMAGPDVLLCALDGYDAPRLALLNGLEALLEKIKMGGTSAFIIMQGGIS